VRTPSMSELAGTAAEKITSRKWCGHCQTYKAMENGVTRVVKGRKYWKCDSCSGKK
jgi:hypothetical protein